MTSAFLKLAHSTSRHGSNGKLDSHFLSRYFSHHPAASVADEEFFQSPTAVMDNFLQSQQQQRQQQHGTRTDANEQHQLDKTFSEFVTLLRAVATTMERHARSAGLLKEAAKAMLVVLSMSPLTNTASYTPRSIAGGKLQPGAVNNSLPWDRLRPLLQEIDQALIGEKATDGHDPHGGDGDDDDDGNSRRGGIFSLAPGGLELVCSCSDSFDLMNFGQRGEKSGVPLAPNANRDHDFFTNEICRWALPRVAVDGVQEAQQQQLSGDDERSEALWDSDPPDWALDAISPGHKKSRPLSEDQQQQHLQDDEYQSEEEEEDREETILQQAARRTDFLRWEVPARRIGGGNSSWPALWRAMHGACIGHGDTLGVVGADPSARPYQPSIHVRVSSWPPALSFAPALLSAFCRCGTLLLRIRHLVDRATAAAARRHHQQGVRSGVAVGEEEEAAEGGVEEFAMGRIGAAIFSAVHLFVRDFEAEIVQLSERLSSVAGGGGSSSSTHKATHRLLLERATILQRDVCPRVFLVAELLHVSSEPHWSAGASLSALGSGMKLLSSLYHWLASNELAAHSGAAAVVGEEHHHHEHHHLEPRTAQLQGVVREMFIEGLHQFHGMLMTWVQRGQLEDPFAEFFLEPGTSAAAASTAGSSSSSSRGGGSPGSSSNYSVARLRQSIVSRFSNDHEDNDDDDDDDDDDDEMEQEFRFFVPDFFDVDLGLVRDAGVAQLLLLAERRTDCVGVLWERVDEIDGMWPGSETLIWSTAPPDPAAVLAMWQDFVFDLLPQSVVLLSSVSPRRLLELRVEQDLAEQQQQQQQQVSLSSASSSIVVVKKQVAAEDRGEIHSVTEAAAATVKQQQQRQRQEQDEENNNNNKNKKKTHAQIWDDYMGEAKRKAANALIAEHEQRMAQSERRSQRALWRQRRSALASERRQSLLHENDLIVATLQEFVASGRARVAVPMELLVTESNDILPLPKEQEGDDDAATNLPPREMQERREEEQDEVRIDDDENDGAGDEHLPAEQKRQQQKPASPSTAAAATSDDTISISASDGAVTARTAVTTATTTTAVPRWQQPKYEITRIGELRDGGGSDAARDGDGVFDDDDGGQEKDDRSFQPDFTWNPLHDRVGSNPEFETPEQISERVLKNSERLLPSHISSSADNNWFLPKGEDSDGEDTKNKKMSTTTAAAGVTKWARDCITLSVPRERKRVTAAENNDSQNQQQQQQQQQPVPIAQLCARYRSIFAPLCRRLIHRAVRVSLQDPCGALRSVTDALISACMLQHPVASVQLQDRILSRLAPSLQMEQQSLLYASADAAVRAAASAEQQQAADLDPAARLRSCGGVWRTFWAEELAGEHCRFLNLALEPASLSSNGPSSSSGLLLLQQIRLVPVSASSASLSGASESGTAGNIALYRHMLDALLPERCVERHGRVLCSLLTWTLVDKMCVALWRGATMRTGTRHRNRQRKVNVAQAEQEEEGGAAEAAASSAAALWQFVNVARGVLTALRQHIWHNVCSASNSFRATLDEKLATDEEEETGRFDGTLPLGVSQHGVGESASVAATAAAAGEDDDDDGDDDDDEGAEQLHKKGQNFAFGLSAFTSRYEALLVQASDACWLGTAHGEVRKCLSELMRLVEQVYGVVVINSAGLQVLPAAALVQATEQFAAAARRLQTQILAASTPTASSSSTSTAAAYAVASAISSALPKNL